MDGWDPFGDHRGEGLRYPRPSRAPAAGSNAKDRDTGLRVPGSHPPTKSRSENALMSFSALSEAYVRPSRPSFVSRVWSVGLSVSSIVKGDKA